MTARRVIWLLGVILAAAALSVSFSAGVGSAQSDAKYIGPMLCTACHKATDAGLVAALGI